MTLSSPAIAAAAAVLLVSLVSAGSRVREAAQDRALIATPGAGNGEGSGVQDRDPPNRRLRANGPFMAAPRRRGPDAAEWAPGPVPETIPVTVNGEARDEEGKPLPRARVFLFSTGILEPRLAGQATADAEGRYRIEAPGIPVVRERPGKTPLRKEITPYADFVVCGTAPGRGLAWTAPQSMYALAEPHPDDIQGRLPLGQPVELPLVFPKPATLSGRVVDDSAQPVPGAKVQVLSADLLDGRGNETGNSLYNIWEALPGAIGFATTDGAGRFSIDRMPDRACLWLLVKRPETDTTGLTLYAATVGGPDTAHGPMPLGASNGRAPHRVRTGEVSITFPRIRRIAVSVVGEETRQPVPGAHVNTLGEDLQNGLVSYGTTDRDGRVILGLPPGRYRGICADPPIETSYLRTYERPLVVEPGEGDQPHELVLNAGCEILVRVTEAGTEKPVAKAFFWKSPGDRPEHLEHLPASTFRGGVLRTDESGLGRAVVPPEPGKRYRLRFAGIQQPNMPDQIRAAAAKTEGYTSDPPESRPIELIGGKTIRLRFHLSKPAR